MRSLMFFFSRQTDGLCPSCNLVFSLQTDAPEQKDVPKERQWAPRHAVLKEKPFLIKLFSRRIWER